MDKDLLEQAMGLHMAEALTRPFAPHLNRHDLAVPTYLENWPPELQRLSMNQVDVPLTREEAVALGSNIIDLGKTFSSTPLPIDSLKKKIEESMQRLPGPYFVRLGSRSPKDAFYWPKDEQKVDTADEVIQLLTAGSERIWEDLRISLHFDYLPHIFLREWKELPEWSEFRCFMYQRRLIGISQYYYRKPYQEILDDWDGMVWAIEQFFNRYFKDASHLDSVVFDVWVKHRGPTSYNSACNCGVPPWRAWDVRLLEINPYWNLTDPCLFTWEELEQAERHEKMLVRIKPQGIPQRTR